MTDKLLEKDPLREGLTALLLGWKKYEQAVNEEQAELQRQIDVLCNRVEILEVQQASQDRVS